MIFNYIFFKCIKKKRVSDKINLNITTDIKTLDISFNTNLKNYIYRINQNDKVIRKLDINIRYKLYIFFQIGTGKKYIPLKYWEKYYASKIEKNLDNLFWKYRFLNSYDAKQYFNYLYNDVVNNLG